MKTERTLTQSIASIALATGLILLIPLALQLTIGTGVDGLGFNWKLGDFVIMGALLFGTGLSYILVTRVLAPRMGDNIVYRVAVGFALFSGLFLIWVNGAVGIIGSENNDINLVYFGVIFVGIIGAFLARFKSRGMTLTLFVMAIAQAIVAAIALFTGMGEAPGSSVSEIIGVNAFFTALFVLSALLFRHAALEQPPANERSEE